MSINIEQILIASSFIAAAGGLLGSFALLKRMALVGDALSHVALPGVALGLLFHFNIFWGALLFLAIGTLMIWSVEHKTKLPVDTIVGIFFSLSLAIGALIMPQEEILDSLFGDITRIGSFDFLVAVVLSSLIILTLFKFSKKIILTMISNDLSLSQGFRPHFIELLFLLIFALTVALGIKFVGALLMGSLVIIPAATARNLAGSMGTYMFLSMILGVASAVLGIIIALLYSVPPGPSFVIISGGIFFASLLFKVSRKVGIDKLKTTRKV